MCAPMCMLPLRMHVMLTCAAAAHSRWFAATMRGGPLPPPRACAYKE